ncbi:MAG: dimethylamine corrinoid protein 3 [Thermoproteota archaeon]|nr:MAG: dimethylamine corrinoid protein 3 [Candidatus Korarchaeota archaeon]
MGVYLSSLGRIAEAILEFDEEKLLKEVKEALDSGLDPVKVLEEGVAAGLRKVGELFEKGELFLMHVVVAAEAAKKAIEELIEPKIMEKGEKRKGLGKVVIGTVAGDIHDIGKNIVAAMLTAAGFEVYDLGKDVPVEKFIEKAREVQADIIAASALLSTSMPVQREIVKALEEASLKGRIKVMVGGAPVTEEWAREIGADGYGADAVEAVEVAKKLVGVEC